MSKAYNIIEAINMPVGTEFEVYLKGKEKPDSKLADGNMIVNCDYEFVWAKNNECIDEIDRGIFNAKFYKVQNPIDFFEAMKLVSEGKKVKNKFGIFKKVGGGLNRGLSGEESGDVWYLVDEDNSVSFIEAIKASQEGMVIHVDAGEKSYTYYPKDDKFSELTAVETKGGLSTHEILSGKWYIEGK